MATFGAADYQIFVRDGNLNLVGQLDQFDSLIYVKRFNQLGSFTLQLSSTHPLAPLLQTPGYGIVIERNGVIDFSGPVRYTERKGITANTVIVKGYDDLYWVAARLAYPVLFYPYLQTIQADNPLVVLAMNDASGTTAADTSGNGQNGTYGGTVTLQRPPLLDEGAKSVLLGANGYVSVPTATLPTANLPYTLEVWFYYGGPPAATMVLAWLGTPSSTNSAYMGITTAGLPTMQVHGVNFTGPAALSVGVHCMQMEYTGLPSNTAGLYVDNIQEVTGTPGVNCSIVYGSAAFGCLGLGASNFAKTTLQYGAIYPTALSIARLNAHVNIGTSIFAYAATDSGSGSSETVLKHFVDYNLGPHAIILSGRSLPNITIETDSGRGTANVMYAARFENLVQADGNGLLQQYARTSVPELGFRMVMVGGNLQFQVYVPQDKTNNVAFAAELGNLADYAFVNDYQTIINYVIAGGGGNGTGRAFLHSEDDPSIASFGRFEAFVAHQSTATAAVLQTDAANVLAQAKSQATFNGTLLDTSAIQYGRDYTLGDRVSVVIDGVVVVTDVIREVQVALSVAGGEVITPAVGTPNNGQILNAYSQITRAARANATRVAQVERAQ